MSLSFLAATVVEVALLEQTMAFAELWFATRGSTQRCVSSLRTQLDTR